MNMILMFYKAMNFISEIEIMIFYWHVQVNLTIVRRDMVIQWMVVNYDKMYSIIMGKAIPFFFPFPIFHSQHLLQFYLISAWHNIYCKIFFTIDIFISYFWCVNFI